MELHFISIDQYYHNGVTNILGHADLMLAELDLPDTMVAVINRARTKLECADRLIEKGMYTESRALESNAVFDLAEVVDFLGLHNAANDIRVAYSDF